MEDKGESKFRNVMERYWYALFIIACKTPPPMAMALSEAPP